MVRSELIIADHGPTFISLMTESDETLVCVVTPRFEDDPDVRDTVRKQARRNGRDCGTCLNCPIGRDS